MDLNVEYFDGGDKEALDVILRGSSQGMETSESVQKIFKAAKDLGRSVAMFNSPFIDRGEKHREDQSRDEEIETLKSILDKCESGEYKKIRLIGKSLGGIVAAEYLTGLSKKDQEKYELVILGFIPGATKVNNIVSKIIIFQGEKDRYGDAEAVRKEVGAVTENITIYGISGADCSFNDPVTGEAKYFDKVLELLFINQKLEKELPQKGRKRVVRIEPVIQKFNYDCGGAAVSNLLLMLGKGDVLKTELYQRLEVDPVNGTRIKNIKKLLDEEGVEYFEASGAGITELEAVLAVGYVCLVCYQAWGTEDEMDTLESGHYSVVFDVDETNVWFIDPSVLKEDEVGEGIGVIFRSREDFDKRWRDKGVEGEIYDHWMLAVKVPY
ncbi:hypothetical protein COY48_00095 [Candidatus Collierbacteria bacterium CG_4_10_14_0_8_um_filter_43_86]|uniref:KANL3/Tex30 alpha/beta hydrolase-like domain-containing protein n=1 Tax=Candidatus Collierbacteria bacterium CG_4_9_14_3_um_filter_43_16 TaxID=1974532 RepID=A0A2M8BVX9_9BACT|nr:MAG: hypothetical protein COY48_00095 [Candidatus Collierbacteria bacterium CG_4_10_14_0_8_um_filter_43_86]PJB47999.1 MAG: hypothetical protein CO104_02335 [Candidatus Collierbacteria bacterium CG_4_9_14_3_um_filter_43_16]